MNRRPLSAAIRAIFSLGVDMGTIPPPFAAGGVAITGGTINATTIGATTAASGRFTTVVATSTITPSSTAGIVGTTTNDNANAGSVGEFITATVATPGTGLTTATPANVTSIALTAGDWDVCSVVDFLYTGATVTDIRGGPSLTTGTLPTQAGGGGLGTDALAIDPSNFVTVADVQTLDSGPVRVLLSAPATVFLVAQATFSAGTVSAFGTVRARRVR